MRAPLASSSKVRFHFVAPILSRPFLWPELVREPGTNALNSQTVAIKLVSLPRVTVHRPDPPPMQEPREAEVSQLRFEYTTYRILAGCRQYKTLSRRVPYLVVSDPPSTSP